MTPLFRARRARRGQARRGRLCLALLLPLSELAPAARRQPICYAPSARLPLNAQLTKSGILSLRRLRYQSAHEVEHHRNPRCRDHVAF